CSYCKIINCEVSNVSYLCEALACCKCHNICPCKIAYNFYRSSCCLLVAESFEHNLVVFLSCYSLVRIEVYAVTLPAKLWVSFEVCKYVCALCPCYVSISKVSFACECLSFCFKTLKS